MPGGAHSVEVAMRGLFTTTAAMGGTAPEQIRNTISASALEVPSLGERIAITIILGDGTSAIALLTAKPNGKAN